MSSKVKVNIKALLTGIAGALALVILASLIYWWGFCRFYVEPGYMAIVTAKSGKTPVSSDILVERGEKGIWKEVLSEGRHFLNPVTHDVKIAPAIAIPLGKVGIVTSKVGKELPPGEVIAPDRQSKGIWREALGPGVYRLNPEGYSVEIADAINIPVGFVGVVTSQTGKNPKPGEFAKPGEKGVMRDILQPGLYYINRYAYQVNVIEIGMNQVSMTGLDNNVRNIQFRRQLTNATNALSELTSNTMNFQAELRKRNVPAVDQKVSYNMKKSARGSLKRSVPGNHAAAKAKAAFATAQAGFVDKRAVEFPSRDGFKVSLDMTVEFELLPENISKIYLLYGDLPQVVEKIILPQVLSISRIKGSNYKAQDFIMGDGREKFQNDLRDELKSTLAGKLIVVHNAIIRNVEIPQDILKPIQAVSLAREQNLTNQAMQVTAKRLAQLNTETELIEQRRREVEQETRKITALISAEAKRDVASIDADTRLLVAKLRLKKAEILAKTRKVLEESQVQAKFMVSNESARGEILKAQALGDQSLMAKMHMIDNLPDNVKTKVIYAGDGTLWTDLNNPALTIPAKREKRK
ncbi:MAG: hypothetical protein E7045_01685 [Lentisphaerae bacterium]|nr:hypothetical protein [Lentisphaerota bacterium]